jgi:hypothetical protein
MITRLRFLVTASLGCLCALNASLFLASCGSSSGGSQSPPPYLSLNASPNPLTIYPSSTFTIVVTATTNASSTPTLTQAQLPSGITTTTTFPITIPSGAPLICQSFSDSEIGARLDLFPSAIQEVLEKLVSPADCLAA